MLKTKDWKVKEFYSDMGTNFAGGVRELEIKSFNVEDSSVKSFLLEQGTVWKFNMPLSSHMGGAFERLIGITWRILDSPLSSFFYWLGFIVDFVSKYPVNSEEQRSCRGFPWPGSRQYLYLTVEVCSTLGKPILDKMAT